MLTSFLRGWVGDRRGCRVVCLIRERLYQMIIRSVFTVSCPSCGAPLVLALTLVSQSGQLRADSLEQIRFLPSFQERWPFLIGRFQVSVSLNVITATGHWGLHGNSLAEHSSKLPLQRQPKLRLLQSSLCFLVFPFRREALHCTTASPVSPGSYTACLIKTTLVWLLASLLAQPSPSSVQPAWLLATPSTQCQWSPACPWQWRHHLLHN